MTVGRLGLNGEFSDRITMAYYEAGHMMYIRDKSHAKIKADPTAFYLAAAGVNKE